MRLFRERPRLPPHAYAHAGRKQALRFCRLQARVTHLSRLLASMRCVPMMNQPKLRKNPTHEVQTDARVRSANAAWTYAPSADEFVPWPVSFEVGPWRP